MPPFGTDRSRSLTAFRTSPAEVSPGRPASSRTGYCVVNQPTVRETSVGTEMASLPWPSRCTRRPVPAPLWRTAATASAERSTASGPQL
ncbi:hypothetical protein SALBM135S_03867 [Streptomyces alboniger]